MNTDGPLVRVVYTIIKQHPEGRLPATLHLPALVAADTNRLIAQTGSCSCPVVGVSELMASVFVVITQVGITRGSYFPYGSFFCCYWQFIDADTYLFVCVRDINHAAVDQLLDKH